MLESNGCEARAKPTSEALCHYWHPVARSTELTDKPVKVKLLDQPVVLWRANGRVGPACNLRAISSRSARTHRRDGLRAAAQAA